MKGKWKKFFSYYKPYKLLFVADMFFAIIASIVTLILPMIVRYITNTVVFFDKAESLKKIYMLSGLMVILVIIATFSNFFI